MANPPTQEAISRAELVAAMHEIGRKLYRIGYLSGPTGRGMVVPGGTGVRGPFVELRRGIPLSPVAKLVVEALLDEIG